MLSISDINNLTTQYEDGNDNELTDKSHMLQSLCASVRLGFNSNNIDEDISDEIVGAYYLSPFMNRDFGKYFRRRLTEDFNTLTPSPNA